MQMAGRISIFAIEWLVISWVSMSVNEAAKQGGVRLVIPLHHHHLSISCPGAELLTPATLLMRWQRCQEPFDVVSFLPTPHPQGAPDRILTDDHAIDEAFLSSEQRES